MYALRTWNLILVGTVGLMDGGGKLRCYLGICLAKVLVDGMHVFHCWVSPISVAYIGMVAAQDRVDDIVLELWLWS